jgi:hypothetical protein
LSRAFRPDQPDLIADGRLISGDEFAIVRTGSGPRHRCPPGPTRPVERREQDRIGRIGVDDEQPDARPGSGAEKHPPSFEPLAGANAGGAGNGFHVFVTALYAAASMAVPTVLLRNARMAAGSDPMSVQSF